MHKPFRASSAVGPHFLNPEQAQQLRCEAPKTGVRRRGEKVNSYPGPSLRFSSSGLPSVILRIRISGSLVRLRSQGYSKSMFLHI